VSPRRSRPCITALSDGYRGLLLPVVTPGDEPLVPDVPAPAPVPVAPPLELPDFGVAFCAHGSAPSCAVAALADCAVVPALGDDAVSVLRDAD
jgi:hypothetical protein